jgi:hypothetical protein
MRDAYVDISACDYAYKEIVCPSHINALLLPWLRRGRILDWTVAS